LSVAASQGLKLLCPTVEQIAITMAKVIEEDGLPLVDAECIRAGELRKRKIQCEEDVRRLAEALLMHNKAYSGM
jgi:hypothetical protein